MQKPPAQMRRGLDESLAAALHTSRRVLFSEFDRVALESADVAWELPPGRHPWRDPGWGDLPSEARARVIIYYHLGSGGGDVEKFLSYGVDLIEAKENRFGRTFQAEFLKQVRSPRKK